jgi:ammonia channel protein AmtB
MDEWESVSKTQPSFDYPGSGILRIQRRLTVICRNIIVLVIISTFWVSYGYRVSVIYRVAEPISVYLTLVSYVTRLLLLNK